MYEITKTADFCAAHLLRGHPGLCGRLHGHNYRLEVVIRGRELDRLDMLVDFYALDEALRPILARVDHRNLNEIPPFDTVNPTAEAIAAWFHRKLRPVVSEISGGRASLAAVRLWETPDACVTYTEDP